MRTQCLRAESRRLVVRLCGNLLGSRLGKLGHVRQLIAIVAHVGDFMGHDQVVLGIHHGLFCLGCCWLIMAMLFVGAAMVARIAVVIMNANNFFMNRPPVEANGNGCAMTGWRCPKTQTAEI